MDFRIDSIWFVALLAVFALLVLGATIRSRRHKWRVGIGIVLTIALFIVTLLSGVNAYFKYIPTFSALVASQPHFHNATAMEVKLSAARQGKNAQQRMQGELVEMSISGTASGFSARNAKVYLPPAYFDGVRRTFPVVVLFHGSPGTPDDWSRGGGALHTADRWNQKHNGMGPIVIMPDFNGHFTRDSQCVNGKIGNVETYLSQDVRNFAIKELRAKSDARSWSVGGLSQGGFCGAMLAMRHPDLFGSFFDFAGETQPETDVGVGELFAGTPEQVAASVRSYDLRELIKSYDRAHQLAGWFASGTADDQENRIGDELSQAANRAGMHTTSIHVPKGRHDFATWTICLELIYPEVASYVTGAPSPSP